ncbi:hypothetical protein [Litoribrevibacter albus]|uniref:Lysozyme n=1 Tax=Litoribrevibacter albus TaxID=1473156 RepID=A0AA37SAT4_9GAMM|nr:hypothetical protein [Litoribrevibacter albus]GLQ32400.1 hypothetical protein GCM10007876_28790 [Litoribrevibacter albus]
MSIISHKLFQLLEILKKPTSENNIPYMYIDTVGKVTVGVGHNLDAHKDMLTLPFMVKRFARHPVKGGDTGIAITTNKVLGRAATQDEIKNDYNFITKHKGLGKYNPENLSKYTTLELSVAAIDALFKKDLNIALAVAKREFGAAFDKYPITCQAALVDIAFNVGNFSSFRGTFVPAIKGTGIYSKKSMSERWKIASQNCRRGQVSADRNRHVTQWLMEGAKNTQS